MVRGMAQKEVEVGPGFAYQGQQQVEQRCNFLEANAPQLRASKQKPITPKEEMDGRHRAVHQDEVSTRTTSLARAREGLALVAEKLRDVRELRPVSPMVVVPLWASFFFSFRATALHTSQRGRVPPVIVCTSTSTSTSIYEALYIRALYLETYIRGTYI